MYPSARGRVPKTAIRQRRSNITLPVDREIMSLGMNNVKKERVDFPYALTMARDARAIAPAVGGMLWTARSTWAFAVDGFVHIRSTNTFMSKYIILYLLKYQKLG